MISKTLLRPSPEQIAFILRSKARQNWAHGPVRSGKNYSLNIRFSEALGHYPKGNEDSDVYFGGKTKDTVYRIFLRDLFSWLGKGNYTYDKSKGKGTISLKWKNGGRFSREFFCFGYSDADSHEAISGATIGLAYLTEGIYCHEDFHRQLIARLSIDEGPDAYSMLFGDTNPASLLHWLWKNVINNPDLLASGDLFAQLFNFYSNPSLTEAKRDELRRQFKPGSLWYQRMIDGIWAMAEGAIYAAVYDEARNKCRAGELPAHFDELWSSLDYGTTNAFVLGLWGEAQGKSWLIDAYDHDGASDGHRTNGQYLEESAKFLSEYSRFYGLPIDELIIDPSAASFKADLLDDEMDDEAHRAWRNLNIKVTDAENDVEPGIKFMDGKLWRGEVVVCDRVKRFHDEIGTYVWDPKAQALGLDKPLKKNDHAMDMARYGLYTRRKRTNVGKAWEMIADAF